MAGNSNSMTSRCRRLDDLLGPFIFFKSYFAWNCIVSVPQKHTSQISSMSHTKPQVIHSIKTYSTATALVSNTTHQSVKSLGISEVWFACSDLIGHIWLSSGYNCKQLSDLVSLTGLMKDWKQQWERSWSVSVGLNSVLVLMNFMLSSGCLVQ